MLGEPRTGDRSGGEKLLDHYWHANSESESMKYSTRGKDNHSTARLQRATEIVESFQKDFERHLRSLMNSIWNSWSKSNQKYCVVCSFIKYRVL